MDSFLCFSKSGVQSIRYNNPLAYFHVFSSGLVILSYHVEPIQCKFRSSVSAPKGRLSSMVLKLMWPLLGPIYHLGQNLLQLKPFQPLKNYFSPTKNHFCLKRKSIQPLGENQPLDENQPLGENQSPYQEPFGSAVGQLTQIWSYFSTVNSLW